MGWVPQEIPLPLGVGVSLSAPHPLVDVSFACHTGHQVVNMLGDHRAISFIAFSMCVLLNDPAPSFQVLSPLTPLVVTYLDHEANVGKGEVYVIVADVILAGTLEAGLALGQVGPDRGFLRSGGALKLSFAISAVMSSHIALYVVFHPCLLPV